MTIKQKFDYNMNVIIFVEATENEIVKILGFTRYLGILYKLGNPRQSKQVAAFAGYYFKKENFCLSCMKVCNL